MSCVESRKRGPLADRSLVKQKLGRKKVFEMEKSTRPFRDTCSSSDKTCLFVMQLPEQVLPRVPHKR